MKNKIGPSIASHHQTTKGSGHYSWLLSRRFLILYTTVKILGKTWEVQDGKKESPNPGPNLSWSGPIF